MKSRKRQRINRRIKEEMLNPRNEYGVCDPTAYEAVRSIIRKEQDQKNKHSPKTKV